MTIELEKRILSTFILIPLCFYFIFKGSILFNFFLILCFTITSHEWYKMSKNKKYHLPGYLFLFFSFYSAYTIRNYPTEESGLFIFMLIIVICVFTDIGGYIVGKIIKGPKLNKISPNKTYSGMIGSYIFSIFSAYILIYYSELLFKEKVNFIINELIFVILISSVSQIGDISISLFKRLSKIKDSGKLIPGHGGILDRIDGMIFAFPISFVIIQIGLIK